MAGAVVVGVQAKRAVELLIVGDIHLQSHAIYG